MKQKKTIFVKSLDEIKKMQKGQEFVIGLDTYTFIQIIDGSTVLCGNSDTHKFQKITTKFINDANEEWEGTKPTNKDEFMDVVGNILCKSIRRNYTKRTRSVKPKTTTERPQPKESKIVSKKLDTRNKKEEVELRAQKDSLRTERTERTKGQEW